MTRLRSNAVAFHQPPKPKQRKRGRPKVYGEKVKLRSLFKAKDKFLSAPSPVYNERGVTLQYRYVDLIWRPVGKLVRFVFVIHPTRGRIILLCTNLSMDALTVIHLYGLRFKIEVSFKQAIHTLGAYTYHFWRMAMTPIKRWSGNQYLHRKPEEYRNAVRRKIGAYHCYVQLGCIAQGILQHLAINYPFQVWQCFRSWLRTMKTDCVPTEMVVATALRHSLFDFLRLSPPDQKLKKMILDNADSSRMPEINMAA